MAHDVFISHSNQDKTVASAICSRLEQAGIRCWIAPRDVRPGRNWGSEVIRGLDNAKVMIVVLSANANRSRPVMKEVERAFEKGIVIIPVRTEEVEPSEALEFFLSSEHWLDAITPPLETHIDRLARTVEDYLIEQGWTGKEGTAASTTAPPASMEPISEATADEIPRTNAVSRTTPSGAPDPPLTISGSAQEEVASLKKATEETEEGITPPPQTEPPAPASEGAPMTIAGPVSLAKTGDAKDDAPSRFAPSSGPAQSDATPVEDAKMESPALEGSQRESPGENAIPVPPRKEQPPFLQTPKGRGILAACAGLAIAATALVFMLSESQTKKQDTYPSPTATPGASGTPVGHADFVKQTQQITATPEESSTPIRTTDILNRMRGVPSGADLIRERLPKNAPESTPNVSNRAQIVPVTTPLPSGVGAATKEKPFLNSLGMRFVPVPGTDVLFSVWETRVKDYQAFCDATGKSWERPPFEQSADHPAVNLSWDDATAFCEWLSGMEGNRYRLPTDHVWSCAVGIGDRENADATPKSKNMKIADVFPWGKQWLPPNDAGNYFGEECKTAEGLAKLKAAGYDVSSLPVIKGFNDGKVFTAAAGSFRPNGLGIYDLGGNVWEWCQDEYEPGSASRVLRGGSWSDDFRGLVLSSRRNDYDPDLRIGSIGFRSVVEAGSGR